MVSDSLIKTYNKEYYEKNRERIKNNYSKYYYKNKELISERNKGYKLKWKYGLSVEDKEKLRDGQNNVCAICALEKFLCVDHCHKTSKVRGLLCHDCNKGLGNFSDNPALLDKAASYLRSTTH